MKPGPKKQTPQAKAKRGTARKDRDGAKAAGGVAVLGKSDVSLVAAGEAPMMPDYLSPAAQEIWQEELPRVMMTGVAEFDSSILARYCATEALVRAAFMAGEPPPAAYLVELRRTAELLGIAGPKVRTGNPGGNAQKENPFAKNARKLG